jgi:hypothetical protein
MADPDCRVLLVDDSAVALKVHLFLAPSYPELSG